MLQCSDSEGVNFRAGRKLINCPDRPCRRNVLSGLCGIQGNLQQKELEIVLVLVSQLEQLAKGHFLGHLVY